MGFWNDGFGGGGDSRKRSRSRSRSRSASRRAPSRTYSQSSAKHYSSRPSFARSASSFFSVGGGGGGGTSRGRSSSYNNTRGAQPRRGFVNRVRRFLRRIYDYMRKHPFKVFFLVIMPLITGGALTKLLSTVGLRLPPSLQRFAGSDMNRGVSERERYYARGGARDFAGGSGLPGMGSGVGESLQGALSIAKMFM